jgi:hypothetical protein
MKFNSLKFALTGGILGAIGFSLCTIATLLNIPGFMPFAQLLEQGYRSYGYNISWAGVIIGAFWGFMEGFIWIGAFGLIYNKLAAK